MGDPLKASAAVSNSIDLVRSGVPIVEVATPRDDPPLELMLLLEL